MADLVQAMIPGRRPHCFALGVGIERQDHGHGARISDWIVGIGKATDRGSHRAEELGLVWPARDQLRGACGTVTPCLPLGEEPRIDGLALPQPALGDVAMSLDAQWTIHVPEEHLDVAERQRLELHVAPTRTDEGMTRDALLVLAQPEDPASHTVLDRSHLELGVELVESANRRVHVQSAPVGQARQIVPDIPLHRAALGPIVVDQHRRPAGRQLLGKVEVALLGNSYCRRHQYRELGFVGGDQLPRELAAVLGLDLDRLLVDFHRPSMLRSWSRKLTRCPRARNVRQALVAARLAEPRQSRAERSTGGHHIVDLSAHERVQVGR